jgi:hypothetical protein
MFQKFVKSEKLLEFYNCFFLFYVECKIEDGAELEGEALLVKNKFLKWSKK